MSLKETFFMLAGSLYFDRPAQKMTLDEHVEALRRSGEQLKARLGASAGKGKSDRLRHVIGIERWGQARLRVFLKAPFVPGGHRAHLPDAELSWDELVREFASTRAETISIAERIAELNPTRDVFHNQFGELSAHGWMRYLHGHAERELRRLN